MGTIRESLKVYKRKQTLGRYEREILKHIEATGLMLPFDLHTGGRGTKENPRRSQQARFEWKRRLESMVRKGLLARVKKGSGFGYDLTSKGENTAEQIIIGELSVEKPWRWDGRWRLLTFDIPEKRKSARDELRSVLQTIGFVQVQKSVWAYPYDCRDAIELIRKKYQLTKEVRYFVVEDIEFDRELREQFELPM